MRWDVVRKAGGQVGRGWGAARERLRRVMPRVALAAAALLVLKLLFNQTFLFGDNPLGRLLDVTTLLVVCFTVVYYGLKSLRWAKRHLLWRVRRRLVITYLFVGLTPLVLLTLLGLVSAIGGSSQALGRITAVQIDATQKQVLSGARTLAESFARLPQNASERERQAWLDEHVEVLRSSLAGARVAVWRGRDEREAAALSHGAPANFVSESADEQARGVGGDEESKAGDPLPGWLAGRAEWSGLAFVPPRADSKEAFAAPSMRAVVRRGNVVLLLSVPVSRALVGQWRESTGLNIRPFFIGAGGEDIRGVDSDLGLGGEDSVGVSASNDAEPAASPAAARETEDMIVVGRQSDTRIRTGDGREIQFDMRRDQFGDPLPPATFFNFWYPIFMPATNWPRGSQATHWAFMVDWSWREASRQFWGDETLGQVWRVALYYTAVAFLVLELLALLSAAWMTRSVTGMVHKLYRATGYIKRGDFSHRIRVRSRDQLGELAAAFNDMSADIESLLKERVERERLEREVEIAAEVQAQLFPRRVPRLSTLEIAGECRAARGVAGDYYDYVEVAPGLVAFALGDVSGKGISAALVMSNLQASLRAQTTIIAERLKGAARGALAATTASVAGGGPPLRAAGVERGRVVEEMVRNINQQLAESTDANRFATLFLALYDDAARTFRYTNAGHNAPVLIRADGSTERLTTGGTMVGAFDFVTYEEAEAALAPGDLLLIFSDGLSEAQNAVGEEYGERRLAEFAVARRALTADELRRAVFDEIERWSGAQERGDDQTLVILKASADKK